MSDAPARATATERTQPRWRTRWGWYVAIALWVVLLATFYWSASGRAGFASAVTLATAVVIPFGAWVTRSAWLSVNRYLFLVVGAFAILRVLATIGLSPRRWPDSGTYFDVAFFGGAIRLWVVPVIYNILPSDVARIVGQVALGVVSWSALAVATAGAAVHPLAKRIGATAIAALGLCTQVTQWDRVLLSESIALS